MTLKVVAVLSLLACVNIASADVNLIQNPDFSAGNTGFTSQYTYSTNIFPEATYVVGNNPHNFHSTTLANFTDHTTGSGLMLIVNGATNSPLAAWQETLPVTPGTAYLFQGWTAEWSSSPAVLHVTINGTAVADYTTIDSVGTWGKFSMPWNSGLATTATIAVSDLSLVAVGN